MDYLKKAIFEKETKIKTLKKEYKKAKKENETLEMSMILMLIEAFESQINYINDTGNLPPEED